MNIGIETRERILRTAFWTLLVLTVAFTCYELIVESFGLGLFISGQRAGKFHMLPEAHLASLLSIEAAVPLLALSIFFAHRKPLLCRLGGITLTLWFVYFLLPRY